MVVGQQFTIPYGLMTNANDELVFSLDHRGKKKLNKYKHLVNDCNSKFKCYTELLATIVFSLVAIFNDMGEWYTLDY